MEQNFSEKKLKIIGEAGMPDRLYIRYAYIDCMYTPYLRVVSEVLFVEWKRLEGKNATKTSQRQKYWILLERNRGAVVWIAGEDFPATIEGFRKHYKNSRLMRHAILS